MLRWIARAGVYVHWSAGGHCSRRGPQILRAGIRCTQRKQKAWLIIFIHSVLATLLVGNALKGTWTSIHGPVGRA